MKVSIIGAGVSGLAAGCYLQMSGFDTVIFERGSTFGGLCSSWRKGEFTFESGFQWLLGSKPANPFYQLWNELIDMKTVSFFTHESRMDIEVRNCCDSKGSKVFHLYTNLNQLRAYLYENGPEDARAIDKLIRSMRRIQSFEIPPMIRKVPQLLPLKEKIRYVRYLPLLFFLKKLMKETNVSFARKLKSSFLREAFEMLFDGEELSLMIITLPLAYNDLDSSGYPIGGAAAFVGRLTEKYLSQGGKIRYNADVKKILVKNGEAKGVLLSSGEEDISDIVLSAADWHYTVFEALGGRFVNKSIMKLGNKEQFRVYYSLFIVSLGLGRTFENESHFLRFPLDREIESPDGTRYSRLEAHIYNYDPTLAPEGKTTVSFSLYTMNADYWIDLRRADRKLYDQRKKEFAEEVITLAEKRFGHIREFIEETDIATPATFFRYTNNWKGSAQGWLPGKNIMARSTVPYELPGLENFYYSGHWSIPGGGLPVAIKSARDVVQIICRDKGIKFGIGQ